VLRKSPNEFSSEAIDPKIHIVKISCRWGSREQFHREFMGGRAHLLQSAKINPVGRGIDQCIKFGRAQSREVIRGGAMNCVLW
jgi:hypothetical protein